MGKLSIIATPIGNLEDITLRALRTLKEADVIACEDTRVSSKLLAHFDISKKLIAYHSNSTEKDFERLTAILKDGKHVALVCDAGTPGISDPGLELVSRVREELQGSVVVEAIPGPSALAAALSISGLRAASFTFYGFLPLKKGRQTLLKEIAESERASVFYESPHRILKVLETLAASLSATRRIGIFRELTKMHEEAIVGGASEVRRAVSSSANHQRGEFVIVVESGK